jgi:hypothetical protein
MVQQPRFDTGSPGAQDISVAAAASGSPSSDTQVPIFARSQYHSYLNVTSVSTVVTEQARTVKLVVGRYDYTHPVTGDFTGSFSSVANVTGTIEFSILSETPFGPGFSGRWTVNGADIGVVTMSYVSKFFRRATVEIDTLAGAVAPQPVPDGAGGMEYFDTVYAKHGWDLKVVVDQNSVPVPAGITPTNSWSPSNLHGLMTSNRKTSTNLDSDWYVHLMVVPSKLGTGRGIMYDTLDVPREGCASFSDDGYPATESSNFGTAANKRQRDVARAFLRSAVHEVTHTFNQVHQEQETEADNSIMTTTPSVADVLGSPTTGEPGVFPDQINLAVNNTVRHHLVHMPDPVIRPGGWPFASWFGSTVLQSTDCNRFNDSELELVVTQMDRVVMGQPVLLKWKLTNCSKTSLVVPSDISISGTFASITITDAFKVQRQFRPYVIVCDNIKLDKLKPGASVSSSHVLFWSTNGFAFPMPGYYCVTVAVTWSAKGVHVGVDKSTDVFVEFPTTDADNIAAGLVMNSEVGKWVALGGKAHHLVEAKRRLASITVFANDSDKGVPRLLHAFDKLGMLPDA